jgi:hypothetical protein
MPDEETNLTGGDEAFLDSPGYQNTEGSPAAEETGSDDASQETDTATAAESDDAQGQVSDEDQAEEATEESGESPESDSADETEKLIQQFAKETGLDPEDPGQRKTLKRLADKEAHILRQSELIKQLKSSAPEELTDAEKEIFDAYKDDEEKEPETRGQPQADDSKPLQATWESAADAYKAQVKAWEKAQKTNDFSDVNKVDNAMFESRMTTPATKAYLRGISQELLQEVFGEILPDIQDTVQARRADNAREWAIASLSKQKGFEDIQTLFKVDGDDPVVVNGNKWPNNPMNRIFAQHPEINDLYVTHHNGKRLSDTDALRLSMMKQFRMLHKIHKGGKIGPKVAKKLVEAGAAMEERKRSDKVRQELNKGPGARQGQKEESYGQTLAKAGRGGAQSLSDL